MLEMIVHLTWHTNLHLIIDTEFMQVPLGTYTLHTSHTPQGVKSQTSISLILQVDQKCACYGIKWSVDNGVHYQYKNRADLTLDSITTVQRRVKQTQYKINTHPHYCWPGCYYSCCYYPDLRCYRTLRQNVHCRRVHSHYLCLTRLTNLNPYHSHLQGRQLQLHGQSVKFLLMKIP